MMGTINFIGLRYGGRVKSPPGWTFGIRVVACNDFDYMGWCISILGCAQGAAFDGGPTENFLNAFEC